MFFSYFSLFNSGRSEGLNKHVAQEGGFKINIKGGQTLDAKMVNFDLTKWLDVYHDEVDINGLIDAFMNYHFNEGLKELKCYYRACPFPIQTYWFKNVELS